MGALHYDPEAGYIVTAFRLTHTVVPEVFRSPVFWGFQLMHLAVYGAHMSGFVKGAETRGSEMCLDWRQMKVIAAVTTFFEVFYTNQCYGRYTELYRISRKMLGNLHDFTFEIRLYLRSSCLNHTRLAARWFTASVILFFYERNCEVSSREWAELIRQGLLKPSEREILSRFHSHQRSLVLMHWSAMAIRDGCNKAKAPPNVVKGLVDKLLKSRALEQSVVDTVDLQMPFQYFHLLNLMVVVNLALWAYGMGTTGSLMAPVTYFFAALIFMGMLELATALSDPFGEDEVDFPVVQWMNDFLENTIVLLEFDSPITVESQLEDEESMDMGRRHLDLFVEENLTVVGASKVTQHGAAHVDPHARRCRSSSDHRKLLLHSAKEDSGGEGEGEDESE